MVVYVSKIKTVLNGSIIEQDKDYLNYKYMVCMINVMTVLNGGICEQDKDCA